MLCLLPGDGGMGSAVTRRQTTLPSDVDRTSERCGLAVRFRIKAESSLPVKPRLRRDPGLRRAGNG